MTLLESIRTQSGLTAGQLGALVGISEETVEAAESGSAVLDDHEQDTISSFLGFPKRNLFDRHGAPIPVTYRNSEKFLNSSVRDTRMLRVAARKAQEAAV